ncbi:MAG: large conductance mechanosensitive channel protein MscL [Flavobacteriaceae bacterium]|nr:large conductance mechanosensitive channel protein MscL [Flavobacteriaceae bacterium]
MGFFKEFKEFAVKGNMMDMAIGIIIGAAFNKVIDSLVKQVLMPPLSMLSNGVNYENRKFVLQEAEVDQAGNVVTEQVAIGYGLFFEALLDFFIIGLTVFIVVKFMNRLKTKAQDTQDKTVTTPKDIELLSQISNLMEEQNSLLKSKKST